MHYPRTCYDMPDRDDQTPKSMQDACDNNGLTGKSELLCD